MGGNVSPGSSANTVLEELHHSVKPKPNRHLTVHFEFYLNGVMMEHTVVEEKFDEVL